VTGRDVPLPSNNMKCELLVGMKIGDMEKLLQQFLHPFFATLIKGHSNRCPSLNFRNVGNRLLAPAIRETMEPLRDRQLTGTDLVWVRRNCIAPLAYHNLRQRLTSNSLLYPLDAATLHNSAPIPH
jgi:hypothetical protein